MSNKTTKKSKTTKSIPKKRATKKVKTTKKLSRFFLIIFFFAFSTTIASYFFYFAKQNSNENIKQNQIKTELVKKTTHEDKLPKYEFEEITKEFSVDYDTHPKVQKQEPLKIDETKKVEIKKPIEKKVEEEKKEPKILPKVEEKKVVKEVISSGKPKLAIIIDDVTTTYQLKKAKEIGYIVNLSFLPPTKQHPISAKIAQEIPHHMIHLPLEASARFKSQEVGVLNSYDSYEKIEKRIKSLRELYPNVKYTNNHTGSVFTSNDIAMNRLYKALKKYNFIFVDSRTSPKSVAKKYALKYDLPYLGRNTFIDNKKDHAYIKNQLLKAVKIAKKNGHAIAIGHPYKETFEVLKNSKEILKEVETVYVHQL